MFEKIAIGRETHFSVSFYIYMNEKVYEMWKNKKRIYLDPEIEVIENVKLIKIEDKIAAVMEENSNVVKILYECGFRGKSELEIVEMSEGVEVFYFKEYKSELGSIGISQGLLINMPKLSKLRIYGKRSGKTYGKEKEFKLIIEVEDEINVREDLPEELLKLLEG